jgi:hypothetical protein
LRRVCWPALEECYENWGLIYFSGTLLGIESRHLLGIWF